MSDGGTVLYVVTAAGPGRDARRPRRRVALGHRRSGGRERRCDARRNRLRPPAVRAFGRGPVQRFHQDPLLEVSTYRSPISWATRGCWRGSRTATPPSSRNRSARDGSSFWRADGNRPTASSPGRRNSCRSCRRYWRIAEPAASDRGQATFIGDTVPLPVADEPVKSMIVHKPDGTTVTVAPPKPRSSTIRIEPGVYTVDTPAGASSFAVNLDPLESKTAPLPVETIEQFGVRLANHSPKTCRPRAAPADVQRRAGKPPEALALADPGGDRHPDLGNLAGGASPRSTPLDPRGGIDDMSMELRRALEQVARRFRHMSGSGLGWRSAGWSGPWPAWPVGHRIWLGREADPGRLAAGFALAHRGDNRDRVRDRRSSVGAGLPAGWPGASRPSIPS